MPPEQTGAAPGSVWAAVPSTNVSIGQTLTIVGAQRMDQFTSSTLKRTFDVIYFGELEGARAQPGPVAPGETLPPGHPHIAGEPASREQNAALPPGHPKLDRNEQAPQPDPGAEVQDTGGTNPHTRPGADVAVAVGKVTPAAGKLGRSIAEIYKQRSSLSAQRVRVRGVVVKSTSGVLDRTFVHLRDGTGSASAGDNDLTLTLKEALAVGQTVLCEGTVTLNRDFGAGYSYPVIIENATLVKE
jgi:hypothetical protein